MQINFNEKEIMEEILELINEIRHLSEKNNRYFLKIKQENNTEILNTLPKNLFNIETFSSISEKGLKQMNTSNLLLLKEKALIAFDILMNEEVSLERIQAKCLFINQTMDDYTRNKAIKQLKTNYIPNTMQNNKENYEKFIKNTERIIRNSERNECFLKMNSQIPRFEKNRNEANLTDTVQYLNNIVLQIKDHMSKTNFLLGKELKSLEEIIEFNEIYENNEISIKHQQRTKSLEKIEIDNNNYLNKKHLFSYINQLQDAVIDDRLSHKGKNKIYEKIEFENYQLRKQIKNIQNTKKQYNYEEKLKIIEEKEENIQKETQMIKIEKELLKLEWNKIENQKQEFNQIERLKQIQNKIGEDPYRDLKNKRRAINS